MSLKNENVQSHQTLIREPNPVFFVSRRFCPIKGLTELAHEWWINGATSLEQPPLVTNKSCCCREMANVKSYYMAKLHFGRKEAVIRSWLLWRGDHQWKFHCLSHMDFSVNDCYNNRYTIFTLSIRTPQLLTMLVLKFEQVQFTTRCCV